MTFSYARLGEKDEKTLRGLIKNMRNEKAAPGKCREILKNPHVFIMAAFDGSEPVGWVYAYKLPRPLRDEVFLYEIDVEKNYRRKGIALQLMDQLKTWCRKNQIQEIFVLTEESNAAAMALYSKTGAIRPHADDALWVINI